MTTSSDQCAQCGAPLAADAVGGVCPKCRGAGAPASVVASADAAVGPAPGTAVKCFGDYELTCEIARGGMGVVYKARQISLNRTVALKVVLAGAFAGQNEIRRFHIEAEAAANLDHPNIVPVYDVGAYDGRHYLSMKFVQGGSLRSELRHYTGQPPRIAALMATVARAVHHAHQRGVLHRDLKPENILLDGEKCPYITDFGLAKHVDQDSGMTLTGAIMGTPAYMAPEQARGVKTLTTAVDIYSLGVILYELLTGQQPFKGETPAMMLMAALREEPKSPRSLKPGIDVDLETITLRCLRKESENRYDSAATLADELERWSRGEPILARPVTSFERGVRWCKRNTAIAATLALAFCAVAALSVVYVSQLIGKNAELRRLFDAEKAARAQADAQRVSAETQREAARYDSYLSDVSLAATRIDDRAVVAARQLIDSAPPAYRHWEWGWLQGQLQTSVMVAQHEQNIRCVDLSTDGKLALSACGNRVVVWDCAGKWALRTLDHGSAIVSAGFSHDGKFIVTASAGVAKKWRLGDSSPVQTVKGGASGATGAVLHQQMLAAYGTAAFCVGDDWTVTVSSLESDRQTQINLGPISGPVLSPDGSRLAVFQMEVPADKQNLTPAQWGKEGGAIKVDNFHLFVYDTAHGDRVADLGVWHSSRLGFLLKVHFSPTGRFAVVAGPTGESSLEELIAAQTDPANTLYVRDLYDVNTGKRIVQLKIPVVSNAVFSADERRFVADAAAETAIFDAASGKKLASTPKRQASLFSCPPIISADGVRVLRATDTYDIDVIDGTTGALLKTLRGHTRQPMCLAMDANASAAVSGGADAALRLWSLGPDPHSTQIEDGLVLQWAHFLPDSRRLMTTALIDGVSKVGIHIWDAATAKLLAEVMQALPNQGLPTMCRAAPRILVGPTRYFPEAQVWDVDRRERLLQVTSAPKRQVTCAAISADGKRLLIGFRAEKDGKGVEIRDIDSGQLIAVLARDTAHVKAVALSADGRTAVTLADMTPVHTWSVSTGGITHELPALKTPVSCELTPDAARLLVYGREDDGTTVTILYDLVSGSRVGTWTQARPFGFTSDGTAFLLHGEATGSEAMEAASLLTQNEVAACRASDGAQTVKLVGHADTVVAAVVTQDGRRLATTDRHMTRLWDSKTGRELLSFPFAGTATAIDFSPDGRRLAVAGYSPTFKGVVFVRTAEDWENPTSSTVEVEAP